MINRLFLWHPLDCIEFNSTNICLYLLVSKHTEDNFIYIITRFGPINCRGLSHEIDFPRETVLRVISTILMSLRTIALYLEIENRVESILWSLTKIQTIKLENSHKLQSDPKRVPHSVNLITKSLQFPFFLFISIHRIRAESESN